MHQSCDYCGSQWVVILKSKAQFQLYSVRHVYGVCVSKTATTGGSKTASYWLTSRGSTFRAVHTMPLYCNSSMLRHNGRFRIVGAFWTTLLFSLATCLVSLQRIPGIFRMGYKQIIVSAFYTPLLTLSGRWPFRISSGKQAILTVVWFHQCFQGNDGIH